VLAVSYVDGNDSRGPKTLHSRHRLEILDREKECKARSEYSHMRATKWSPRSKRDKIRG
jgi:hypothetical protein